jgi:uncharacterized protein (TIGR03067 family)
MMLKHVLRLNGVVALAACMWAAFAHAEVLELEGTVKNIDPDARAISIVRKTPKGEKVLDLEVAKNAGDIGSIKVGDRVSFAYNPDVEIISKIEKGMSEEDEQALKELQGIWMAVKVDRHGTMMPQKDLQEQARRIVIEGNKLTFEETREGKAMRFGGTFTIDPQKRTLDLIGKLGGNDFNILAIYEVNGDELRLCYRKNSDGRAERPTEFKAFKETPNFSMSYTCKKLKLD